jgi:hypothetical protein
MITNTTSTIIHHNDLLILKLKPKLLDNPLLHAAIVTKPPSELISAYLDSQVSALVRQPYGDLPVSTFPEKKFKQRYLSGLKSIIQHEFIENDL